MLTRSLDLAVTEEGEGDSPFTPFARIYVKNYTTDEGGLIAISPECDNLKCLETEIDRLREELEILRSKARREFSKI
jgi:hypothetical protein